MINFLVSIKSGAPIYEQVIFAVKKAVASGQLRAGDRFPSVRELSRELKINPNTAQKIVSNLVQEKILEMRPGIGSSVAPSVEATPEQRTLILKEEVQKLIVETRRLSISKEDLIGAIEQHWNLGDENDQHE